MNVALCHFAVKARACWRPARWLVRVASGEEEYSQHRCTEHMKCGPFIDAALLERESQ